MKEHLKTENILEPILVPKDRWYLNLRSILEPEWAKISKYYREKANNRCQICGREVGYKNLDAHEEWMYDTIKFIQTLKDIKAVCKNCHDVLHIGNTRAKAEKKGNPDIYKNACLWMHEVNKQDGDTEPFENTLSMIDYAFSEWSWKSSHSWCTYISNEYLEELLKIAGSERSALEINENIIHATYRDQLFCEIKLINDIVVIIVPESKFTKSDLLMEYIKEGAYYNPYSKKTEIDERMKGCFNMIKEIYKETYGNEINEEFIWYTPKTKNHFMYNYYVPKSKLLSLQ